MINETTWHRDENKQKHFVWSAVTDGIQFHHTNENPSYVVPWAIFHAITTQARTIALSNNNVVTAGTNQTNPTQGSVGEWVLDQNFSISTGYLTPRHLSFIGPVLGRMGFIRRQINGNSIQWLFN